MEEPMVVNRGDDLIDLPPGFRFHPTDEEIITHYLTKKVLDCKFSASAIGEADLNKCEPWDLPNKAKMGEKEFYFFSQKDRKYPTGMRTNRATESGYWKATGKDKEIYRGKNLVGMKKTLVFYRGRAPKGEKTNWVMHEYRLEGKFSYYNLPRAAKEEWVVSRIFNKSTGIKKGPIPEHGMLNYSSLPPLMESPYNSSGPSTSYANNNSEFKAMIDHHSMLRSMEGNYPYHHATTSSANNYFPNGNNTNTNGIIPSNTTSVNPMFYPHIQTLFSYPSPSNLHQAGTGTGTSSSPVPEFSTPGYGNPAAALKVEQYSSTKSMVSVSQDTGISTDMNTTTEISSANSKEDNIIGCDSGLFDQGLRCPSTSVGPAISDMLEYSWDYQPKFED